MNDGDIVLLENTRYRAEETKNGEAFSKELASLCDVFVNDAFGTAHRAHCSNVGVTQFVDTAVVGYLMQKEIDFLGNAVENPERPFVAILGGSKVSSKISVINNLLEKVDTTDHRWWNVLHIYKSSGWKCRKISSGRRLLTVRTGYD